MPSFSWHITTPAPRAVPVVVPTVSAKDAVFGVALDCTADINLGRIVTGYTALSQAILRRLSTPRGALLNSPLYGYDLRQLLNAPLSTADVTRAQIAIAAECQKDERVTSASVDLTFAPSSNSLTAFITLATAAGPFKLVMNVSAVTVEILRSNS